VAAPPLEEELHPLRHTRVETRRKPNSNWRGRRRRSGIRKSMATETASSGRIVRGLTAAIWVWAVVTVRTEVPEPVRETLAGAKVQAA
jgi:hypothetical protein